MKVLCPIPNIDFDPTEVSIPWQALVGAGHEVVFATPDGHPGSADFRMVTGQGLGILKGLLMADPEGLSAYAKCSSSHSFLHPVRWDDIYFDDYDALLLPGGHAKGMRPYLESEKLQQDIVEFFKAYKPVAAICHGTLLAARSIDPETGKSVLYGRQTTGLNFMQELIAWLLTFLWLKDYYRTYPVFMEKEVRSLLKSKTDFHQGPMPITRDSSKNLKPGFTHLDGKYLSARWPGDAHSFAKDFVKLLD